MGVFLGVGTSLFVDLQQRETKGNPNSSFGGALRREENHMGLAQKTGTKMGCPGKWKNGPKPA